MYILRAYFGGIPQEGAATLLIGVLQVVPFLLACTMWVFQLRCWSMKTPRYLVLGIGSIVMSGSIKGNLSFLLFLCVTEMDL